MTTPATIAASLSDAQRSMILHARPNRLIDGEPSDFRIYGRGVVKHALMRRGLATGVHLTEDGLAVRQHLQGETK